MNNWKMQLKDYKLVVLDFDGTLTTLATDWEGLKKDICEILKIEYRNLRLTYLFNAIKSRRGGAEYKRALELRAQYEIRGFDPKSNNTGLIEYIKSSEQEFSIFSMNTESAILQILKNLGVDNRMTHIIGGDSVFPPKPDIEGLVKLIKWHNADVSKTVLVGDSDFDENCAYMAGIPFVRIDAN